MNDAAKQNKQAKKNTGINKVTILDFSNLIDSICMESSNETVVFLFDPKHIILVYFTNIRYEACGI